MSKLTTLDFHGDTLFAAERSDGIYVAVRPISDRLGLDWSAQYRRLRRDAVLAEGVAMMAMPSVGGPQETTALRLDLLNGWLFGLDAARVKPECRDAVVAYQRECFAVLHGHFYGRRGQAAQAVAMPEPSTAEPVNTRRQLVAECRQTFGAPAARQLWVRLGLDTVPAMFGDPTQGAFPFTYTAIRQDAANPGER